MKRTLIAAMLSLGLALVASQASARTYQFTGSICVPVPGSYGCVEYTQFGVHNTCAGAATVECPLAISYVDPNPNVYQTYFVAYDRSTTAAVSCTLQKTDTSGNVLYTSTLSTTSTGGPTIKLFLPNVAQGNGAWRLRCSIPGVQSGQFSHVASVLVGTNESP